MGNRLTRLPYFLWWLSTTFVVLALYIGFFATHSGVIPILVVEIIALVIQIYLAVLRLHDVGRTGWWCLVFLVPLVNIVFGIYLFFAPSSEDT